MPSAKARNASLLPAEDRDDVKEVSRLRIHFGPSMRMRLFVGVCVRSLNSSKPIVALM